VIWRVVLSKMAELVAMRREFRDAIPARCLVDKVSPTTGPVNNSALPSLAHTEQRHTRPRRALTLHALLHSPEPCCSVTISERLCILGTFWSTTACAKHGQAAAHQRAGVGHLVCHHQYALPALSNATQLTRAVFAFTFALFLSGYVLQQRYVQNLQAAIKPRIPKPLPVPKPIEPPTLDEKWARPVGDRGQMEDTMTQYMSGQELDWSRLGYVQVVREHVELCSAVMLLSDLHRMKSPARRVLMFPKSWLHEADDKKYSAEMSTTRRLLGTAARRYGVTLMPMEPILDGADSTLPSSYSLASLYSLVDYERLIYLQGPGVLLDASSLDSLLAFSQSEPMAAYPASPERNDMSTSLLMIHPTAASFQQLKALRSTNPTSDLDLFRATFSMPSSLISEWSLSMGNVVYESPSLRALSESDSFNATAFEQSTTFVRLSDPEIPGPEYDIPYSTRVKLRPKNEQAQEAWSRLYERFRQQRMEVCGLDLEYYSPLVLTGLGEALSDEL
jgi:hypothetical protein